jgi:hypothetical protein
VPEIVACGDDFASRSPDGRWILFDRFVPHGGDLWTIEI